MSKPLPKPLTEEQRIGKQMIAITKAAAQSPNPAYREAAARWRKFIERQLEKAGLALAA